MLYTKQELAEYLNTTPRTVDRLVAAGHLPVIKMGRSCRYRDKDVEQYLKDQTIQRPLYDNKNIYPGVKYIPGMKVV